MQNLTGVVKRNRKWAFKFSPGEGGGRGGGDIGTVVEISIFYTWTSYTSEEEV